jgi:hypothetical protein
MLAGYEGAIVTDAYGGYSRLTKNPSIRLQHCWSHARREFFERYDDFPEDCARVIHLIDEILGLEYEIRTMEDFARIRLGKSKAAVDQLRELLFEMKPKYLPGQGISKAIGYTLRHWSGLTHVLKDATANGVFEVPDHRALAQTRAHDTEAVRPHEIWPSPGDLPTPQRVAD